MEAALLCKTEDDQASQKKTAKTKGSNKFHQKKQSMHASWRLTSPRDNVWNHLYRRPHCRQRIYFDDPLQFGAQVYSNATSDESSGCERSSGQGKEEARDKSSMEFGKKSSKKEVILDAQGYKKKFPLSFIDEHLSSQKCGVRTPIQKNERRFVKDDSGAHAVFTEQGSSASQMIAAKVMDVIARLHD